ncbi:MAG: hypothetical protein RI601_00265 [Desulfurivibrionaceae bacterium]|nr:hypothetical protein [Desulfurivibrionaceae bacterium]
MFINPAIIGLTAASLLVSGVTIYASIIGAVIIRSWDINSGSERQLQLERKTYLISTVLSYVLVCELLSLLLFVVNADTMHSLFTGAMCAAGTLYANSYGYPTLLTKIAVCIMSGVWLIVNHVDNRAYDYPLIKFKYGFLQLITVIIILEAVLQINYFMALDPEIITSCCGTLFSGEADTLTGELAHLSPLTAKMSYYLTLTGTFTAGAWFLLRGRGALIFSFFNSLLFFVSLAAIISFISLYFYDLPTHHCPFCILQKEYHYAGYILYLALFTATIAGGGIAALAPFTGHKSLEMILPRVQRKLCLLAMIGHAVFATLCTYQVLFSDLKLGGYS